MIMLGFWTTLTPQINLDWYYNPMTKPADIKIDQEKIRIWMERGAHPSDTVRSLLKQAGFAD